MRALQSFDDARDDRIELRQHVMIPKPEDTVPLLLQVCGSISIRRCFGSVLTAIEFDHEPVFHAEEVRNESADGLLSAELGTFKAPVAQVGPERAFRVGSRVAEVARAIPHMRGGVVPGNRHRPTLALTLALSRRERGCL